MFCEITSFHIFYCSSMDFLFSVLKFQLYMPLIKLKQITILLNMMHLWPIIIISVCHIEKKVVYQKLHMSLTVEHLKVTFSICLAIFFIDKQHAAPPLKWRWEGKWPSYRFRCSLFGSLGSSARTELWNSGRAQLPI